MYGIEIPRGWMMEVTVVPWSLCWAGCVLAIVGLLTTLHFSDQRNPSRLARVSPAAVVLGVALVLGPLLINFGFMFLGAMHTIALEAAAAARPAVPDADR